MHLGSIAARSAYLFLWCPSAMLWDGLSLVHIWGFKQKATMVWIKKGITGKTHLGMGHHVRNAHELVIVGVHGRITAMDRSVPSFIEAPRTKHSAKPEAFQDAFERIAPGPRLELFARRHRPGWVCWGNEIEEREAI